MNITWRVGRMMISLTLATFYLCFGGILFWLIEGETFSVSPFNSAVEGKMWGTYLNAIYFCAITLTTIGYGDLVPTTRLARVVLFFYAAIGLGVMGITMAAISDVVVFKTQRYIDATSSILHSEHNNDRKQDIKRSHSLASRCCLHVAGLSRDAKKIIIGITFLFVVLGLGALMFMIIEDWAYVESVYFCFVTLTTIGYGDFTPQTSTGRAIVIPFAFLGLGITSFLVTRFAHLFVSKAKGFTKSVNNSQSSFLISFDFEESIEEDLSEILKVLNKSIIPYIQTTEDADKLQNALEEVLRSIESKRKSIEDIQNGSSTPGNGTTHYNTFHA